MTPLLLLLAFVLLQAIVLVAAIGCYVRQHRAAYYAVLYAPAIVFGLIAQFGGGAEDWFVMAAIQSGLSLTYNLYLSTAKRAPE